MSWIDDITDKVVRRIPELGAEANEDLCSDLIEDAFRAIVSYSKANSYNTDWDSILVRSVAMLYNDIGTEGLTARTSLGTTDTYYSTDVISELIQGNIPQYIRPSGYVYSAGRFTYPS